MKSMNLPSRRPLVQGVRAMVRDNAMAQPQMMLTFDGAPVMVLDRGYPVVAGKALGYGVNGRGGIMTHDGRTVDSTGAFLLGELERLDMKLHEPLVAVSWGRDIDIREDVTIADEWSSFTLTTFASGGSLGANNGIGGGKSWIGKSTDQITGVGVDISKPVNPLNPWGQELKYTILELESAAKIGRPIDQQKYAGMQLKFQMDVDAQVYYGDTEYNQKGLVNNGQVTPSNVVNGASGSPLWTTKTPAEILADVNTALNSVWTTSAFARMPSRILLPTAAYSYIASQMVSLAGDKSILKYILENNLRTQSTGAPLEIFPAKWCNGAGAGGTIGTGSAGFDRMVVYSKDPDLIRFPMTMLQRTAMQFDSIYHKCTYFNRLGVVELVYPQTVGYFDGMS